MLTAFFTGAAATRRLSDDTIGKAEFDERWHEECYQNASRDILGEISDENAFIGLTGSLCARRS